MKLIFNTIDKKRYEYSPKFPDSIPIEQQLLSEMSNFKTAGYLKISDTKIITFSSILTVDIEK